MRISDWSSDVCSYDLVLCQGGIDGVETSRIFGAHVGRRKHTREQHRQVSRLEDIQHGAEIPVALRRIKAAQHVVRATSEEHDIRFAGKAVEREPQAVKAALRCFPFHSPSPHFYRT